MGYATEKILDRILSVEKILDMLLSVEKILDRILSVEKILDRILSVEKILDRFLSVEAGAGGACFLVVESLNKSHHRPASIPAPAGMRNKQVWQEPLLPGKLLPPCRNENRASGAGAAPAWQASSTLPH